MDQEKLESLHQKIKAELQELKRVAEYDKRIEEANKLQTVNEEQPTFLDPASKEAMNQFEAADKLLEGFKDKSPEALKQGIEEIKQAFPKEYTTLGLFDDIINAIDSPAQDAHLSQKAPEVSADDTAQKQSIPDENPIQKGQRRIKEAIQSLEEIKTNTKLDSQEQQALSKLQSANSLLDDYKEKGYPDNMLEGIKIKLKSLSDEFPQQHADKMILDQILNPIRDTQEIKPSDGPTPVERANIMQAKIQDYVSSVGSTVEEGHESYKQRNTGLLDNHHTVELVLKNLGNDLEAEALIIEQSGSKASQEYFNGLEAATLELYRELHNPEPKIPETLARIQNNLKALTPPSQTMGLETIQKNIDDAIKANQPKAVSKKSPWERLKDFVKSTARKVGGNIAKAARETFSKFKGFGRSIRKKLDRARTKQLEAAEQVAQAATAPEADAPKADAPKADAPKAETPEAETAAPEPEPAKPEPYERVLNETIQTERGYLKDMTFLGSLDKDEIKTAYEQAGKEERKSLSDINDVYKVVDGAKAYAEAHKGMLDAMEAHPKDPKKWVQAAENSVRALGNYMVSFETSLKVPNSITQQIKDSPQTGQTNINSLAIMPVQRGPRYQMLGKDIMKRTTNKKDESILPGLQAVHEGGKSLMEYGQKTANLANKISELKANGADAKSYLQLINAAAGTRDKLDAQDSPQAQAPNVEGLEALGGMLKKELEPKKPAQDAFDLSDDLASKLEDFLNGPDQPAPDAQPAEEAGYAQAMTEETQESVDLDVDMGGLEDAVPEQEADKKADWDFDIPELDSQQPSSPQKPILVEFTEKDKEQQRRDKQKQQAEQEAAPSQSKPKKP